LPSDTFRRAITCRREAKHRSPAPRWALIVEKLSAQHRLDEDFRPFERARDAKNVSSTPLRSVRKARKRHPNLAQANQRQADSFVFKLESAFASTSGYRL